VGRGARARRGGDVAFAAGPVLVVVALKCALELAVAGRYGWHRDELCYAVAGLHLQGGYVEFPPVTALAALARELFGLSLVGLRTITILASAGTEPRPEANPNFETLQALRGRRSSSRPRDGQPSLEHERANKGRRAASHGGPCC
jgi:hypothetical protein